MKKTLLFILCTLFSINVFGQVSMKDVEEYCKIYENDWKNSAIKMLKEINTNQLLKPDNNIKYTKIIKIKNKSKYELYLILKNIFKNFEYYFINESKLSDNMASIAKDVYIEKLCTQQELFKKYNTFYDLFYIDISPCIHCIIFDEEVYINCFVHKYYIDFKNNHSSYHPLNLFFPYNKNNLKEYQEIFAEAFVKSNVYCKLTIEYIEQSLLNDTYNDDNW